ncbi:response regulator transcription factor [Intrasporangium calvum]|uniref:Response regulator transcription factor n=1 Tax=Intrasporangium calvum TaxID=53358 RepID=A0ABT5GGX0_9MICO|nr:response regulator transcription factor [Intrasporangium calvum]MDC5697476.1 response regulator transcription factor [Intrasporangium calvum]
MTSSGPIRVAIADDQELMRSALAMVVGSQPDLDLVGEADDGVAIVELCRSRRVDVVLMDVRMPRVNGIEATRRLLASPAPPRIIVVTTFDLDEYAFAALHAGASGFLLKDARGEDILDAIRVVHAGHAVVSPATTRRLIEHLVTSPPPDGARAQSVIDALTAREQDVLLELATGASNAEIARKLFLSEATVKTHVGHVLGKLDLRDRVQAVVLAYEAGLVRPGG